MKSQERRKQMPKRKSKSDPRDDRALASQVPAEEEDERTRWELLSSRAGLPEIGAVVDRERLFRFATQELTILARLAPDWGVRLEAAQFLFREFNSRPGGGLSEREEIILKLRREVLRAAVEEDGSEPIELAEEISGTARLPAPAGQDKNTKGE
jgi:hypothetical protein